MDHIGNGSENKRIYTCRGSAWVEGAGASQMHKGIPHLHSEMTDTESCSAVGPASKFTSVHMSTLETVTVTWSTPYKEACGSSFPDL